MIHWLESSFNLRFFAPGIAATLSLLGITQLRSMALGVLLKFTSPHVQIQSAALCALPPIPLRFEDGTDVMRARALVPKRLTQAYRLPT
jgi:hypothetical protein